jgi:PIN domain nuclease of toxin-antitoxin system
MRLLLDANAFLWWVTDSPLLSIGACEAIADDANSILVGIGSLWELSIKRSIGKLDFPHDFQTVLRDEIFELLPITFQHLAVLGSLPLRHRDPFDRLLIAQSIAENVVVVTNDQKFALYDAHTYW